MCFVVDKFSDQWSPLNPEGKKQYDRNFMLQLQFANPSIVKPVGLPPMLDIILNEVRSLKGSLSIFIVLEVIVLSQPPIHPSFGQVKLNMDGHKMCQI